MNSKIIAAIAIAAIAIGFVGYSSLDVNQERTVDDAPVRIAINVWPGYAHAFIAQEQGFFEKNGVDVELIFNEEYSDSQKLYNKKQVDGIFEVFSDTITHNAQSNPTQVVYVADYSTSGDAVVADVEDVSQLKGKKIGVEGLNSFSHIFMLKLLEKYGLSEADVEFVNTPGHDVLEKLESREINAGHTWSPTKQIAVEKGFYSIAEAGDVPGIITDVLSFDADFVEKRPADIRNVVKSMIEAEEFLRNNPEEGVKIMSQFTQVSEFEMEEGLKGVKMLDLESNLHAMDDHQSTESLHFTGAFIAEYFIERGQMDSIPDLDFIINPQFIGMIEV